ncbi:hypothetical protein [Alkalihalophilus marmarensis]|uniref:hypothetical protein n=1 Tax=Alkalihalophilus marmarensis TaxID=521377 RepID=UPI002E1CF4D5|nr:hypothetical protein [Alkalihalophilus marmarensis]
MNIKNIETELFTSDKDLLVHVTLSGGSLEEEVAEATLNIIDGRYKWMKLYGTSKTLTKDEEGKLKQVVYKYLRRGE